MSIGLWLLGAGALGYSLHRLCLWLERHGYLYYVNSWRSGSRGSLGLALASAIDPNARRVLEDSKPINRPSGFKSYRSRTDRIPLHPNIPRHEFVQMDS
ncbi:MAG TPA: hypothetical protein VKM54_21170 [Myxococcota bacterium]|nr:hypothetical protein [Myxococcota bacterium]